ncbi:DMT family transporter [Rhodovibrionaceae bacterium A322]
MTAYVPALKPVNQGVTLVLLSALTFSTMGLFTKGISSDAWTIIFWRGVFAMGFLLAWSAWREGTTGLRSYLSFDRATFFIALISAVATAAFLTSFKHTTVANVALIFAAAPFVSAALAWIILREAPGRATLVTAAVALAGIAIMISGSLGGLHLKGDLLACVMTLLMSLVLVLMRRHPGVKSAPMMSLSSLMLLLPALIWSAPFDLPLDHLAWLALFGLIFAFSCVALVEGAKLLTPGKTALLSAAETPLAPLLAWLLLAELPSQETFVGGSLILAALACYLLWEARKTH